MARSRVTFNTKAFERNLKKVANEGVQKLAGKLSTMLNSMSAEFTGRSVDEIKPVLQQRWRATAGGSITDPELTQYAEQIAAGGTFNIKADKLS